MCLLVVCSGVVRGFPLVVAANRDERLDRPAVAITVLRDAEPRILGGRDELAGGTWLAVNDRGVVAGLTNRPSSAGRDPSRRSRGELPLILAGEASVDEAIAAFSAKVDPSAYNAAWLLVGDRRALTYIEIDGEGAPRYQNLPAGIHILENRPLDVASGKVDRAREVLGDPSSLSAELLVDRLTAVLSDHEIAPDPLVATPTGAASRARPACVHGDGYGTRSATIVLVPDEGQSVILVADGRPCSNPFTDQSWRWSPASTSAET